MLDVIDHYLGERDGIDLSGLPPVQVRLEGEDESRPADTWTGPGRTVLYLSNASGDPTEGALLADPPPADEPPDVLEIDPEAQNPCLGETPYAIYTSERMDRTVTIVGSVTVSLVLDATTVDADAVAALYEVRGDSWDVVAWGAQRGRWRDPSGVAAPLEPGEPFEMIVRLQPTTREIEPVSRLVLVLSGADCGYIENPHTGEPVAAQTHREPTTLSIHLGALSRLELPTME
jgi:predicted acyl esterase